jgi:hypothetical protein
MTSNIQYIRMDVHKESISIAFMNSVGKVVMESVIETKASLILRLSTGCVEICRSPLKNESRTPNLHRAKTAHIRVRMEGWRQRRLG